MSSGPPVERADPLHGAYDPDGQLEPGRLMLGAP
jgi:hypothetical protein